MWSIPHRGYCSSFLINYFRQNRRIVSCTGGPLSWLTLTYHILRCLTHTKRLEDHVPLCPYLSAAGFDAVRLLRRDDEGSDILGELVDCRPQCTAAYLKGACVDGLRAGWDGRQPCECNDSFPVLNCFGMQPPPWRARVQATARCQGQYSTLSEKAQSAIVYK